MLYREVPSVQYWEPLLVIRNPLNHSLPIIIPLHFEDGYWENVRYFAHALFERIFFSIISLVGAVYIKYLPISLGFVAVLAYNLNRVASCLNDSQSYFDEWEHYYSLPIIVPIVLLIIYLRVQLGLTTLKFKRTIKELENEGGSV